MEPTPPNRRRVVLTGATGYIAGQLLPAFRERYDLVLVDVRDHDRDGRPVAGVQVLDLLDDPGDRFGELCRGADAVVHAGHLKPQGTPTYAAERRNVDMAARVYEAAQAAGVRRLVVTSTNQASKWYERPWREGRIDRVGPEDYPRPDTWYGWAKVAYESMGFLYATGQVGPVLENVQIRIVAPRPIRAEDFVDRPAQDFVRDLTGWVSPRDLQQLYVRSIEAGSVADEHGVPFQIFYGVSGNARTFWSTANARRVVGYAPQDDSEREFADAVAEVLGRG
ncbi:NAD-dependent epimerase/dehydratase family protein [Auraticoccus sp. F435]|uniref:NAD-dependent epimerase/dehydratase family protein n=1 Tax=Auraticoccus cholistanensis TaxID=2656650 RepID=A0A6A9UPH8_9ACTN|nr:NAD(P)-dependent oxidoreductase [Auraticoccus cholistanensis]MVA74448.1 NAD-dependent epimerase/dehydratase family protein [Auraticoccus cholistanensis]